MSSGLIHILSVALSLTVVHACAQIDTSNYFTPIDTSTAYFPVGVFLDGMADLHNAFEGKAPEPGLPPVEDVHFQMDAFYNNWYSRQLHALHEPKLFKQWSDTVVHRFTWLRSFHHPVAVRVEVYGETARIHWVIGDGAGGYAPGKIRGLGERDLSPKELKHFEDAFASISFWSMKTTDHSHYGEDGAEWICEVRDQTGYHVVHRWSPDPCPYRSLCMIMIELAGLTHKVGAKY